MESFPQCVCWHCASGCAPSVSCPNYRCLYSFTTEWQQLRSHLRWCVTTCWCHPHHFYVVWFVSSQHTDVHYSLVPTMPHFHAYESLPTWVTSQTLESTQMGGVPDIGARTIPKELLVIMSTADVCVGMSGWCHSALSNAKQPDMSRSTIAQRITSDQGQRNWEGPALIDFISAWGTINVTVGDYCRLDASNTLASFVYWMLNH